MDSEAKIIIAFLFKRSGKNELKASELYLPLSMNLQWFSPNESKAFVTRALTQKLLTKKGEWVSPNFDYEDIVIPAGFRPSKQSMEKKKEAIKEKQDVMKIIIGRILEKTDLDEQGAIEKINTVGQQRYITKEVAAALVGKEFDIYLDDCFEEIEKTLEKI